MTFLEQIRKIPSHAVSSFRLADKKQFAINFMISTGIAFITDLANNNRVALVKNLLPRPYQPLGLFFIEAEHTIILVSELFYWLYAKPKQKSLLWTLVPAILATTLVMLGFGYFAINETITKNRGTLTYTIGERSSQLLDGPIENAKDIVSPQVANQYGREFIPLLTIAVFMASILAVLWVRNLSSKSKDEPAGIKPRLRGKNTPFRDVDINTKDLPSDDDKQLGVDNATDQAALVTAQQRLAAANTTITDLRNVNGQQQAKLDTTQTANTTITGLQSKSEQMTQLYRAEVDRLTSQLCTLADEKQKLTRNIKRLEEEIERLKTSGTNPSITKRRADSDDDTHSTSSKRSRTSYDTEHSGSDDIDVTPIRRDSDDDTHSTSSKRSRTGGYTADSGSDDIDTPHESERGDDAHSVASTTSSGSRTRGTARVLFTEPPKDEDMGRGDIGHDIPAPPPPPPLPPVPPKTVGKRKATQLERLLADAEKLQRNGNRESKPVERYSITAQAERDKAGYSAQRVNRALRASQRGQDEIGSPNL